MKNDFSDLMLWYRAEESVWRMQIFFARCWWASLLHAVQLDFTHPLLSLLTLKQGMEFQITALSDHLGFELFCLLCFLTFLFWFYCLIQMLYFLITATFVLSSIVSFILHLLSRHQMSRLQLHQGIRFVCEDEIELLSLRTITWNLNFILLDLQLQVCIWKRLSGFNDWNSDLSCFAACWNLMLFSPMVICWL